MIGGKRREITMLSEIKLEYKQWWPKEEKERKEKSSYLLMTEIINAIQNQQLKISIYIVYILKYLKILIKLTKMTGIKLSVMLVKPNENAISFIHCILKSKK